MLAVNEERGGTYAAQLADIPRNAKVYDDKSARCTDS